MVNFGYPYNDIVICKDSTDYLTTQPEFSKWGTNFVVKLTMLMLTVKYTSCLCTCLILLHILQRELLWLNIIKTVLYIHVSTSLLKMFSEFPFIMHQLLFYIKKIHKYIDNTGPIIIAEWSPTTWRELGW